MTEAAPLALLRARLPRHATLLAAMASEVTRDDHWRFLEVGCSLGAGGGDELSDIDAGIGYDGIEPTELDGAVARFAARVGHPVDVVVHRMDGWPEDTCRLVAEYDLGLQLDLVVMPAGRRAGLPDRSFAVVDKDQRLTDVVMPAARHPPSAELAREWVVLGWWAIATADKYVRRESLFEAVHAIDEARGHALRLWAAARGIPYPAFGLTSLLDFPPFELPAELAATYALPGNAQDVAAANRTTAELLTAASAAASTTLGVDVGSPLAASVRSRLTPAAAPAPDRPLNEKD